MYNEHFRLTSEPFALTPDPAFLYLSPGHAEALAALRIGLQSRRGLMVMSGEVGTGKTTLLYSLLSQLGTEVHTAYVSNTRLSFDDILRQTLADFGVPCERDDRVGRLQTLSAFLLKCASEDATAALIVDEAQNLDDDTFEDLRLLSNVETFTAKLLQIVLVGQPELEAKLRRPHLRQVAERVAVHCHINPLSQIESVKYVQHRLECAGGSTDIFTSPALSHVLRRSSGIPRRINIACHNALLFAYGRGDNRVSWRTARAAVRARNGDGLVTLERRGPLKARLGVTLPAASRSRLFLGAAAALAGLGALIAAGVRGNTSGPTHAIAEAPATETLPIDPAPPAVSRSNPAESGPGSESPAQRAEAAAATEPAAGVALAALQVENTGAAPFATTETGSPGAIIGPHAIAESAAPMASDSAYDVVTVPAGASLRGLILAQYGRVTTDLLRQVHDANPRITDIDIILAGDKLRFPRPR